MSDIARTWAAAQDAPTSKAKDVLKELAQWADAEGEVWVLVGVLAMACQCTDRTIQRSLAALKGARLIIETGRQHEMRGGRQVPIYRLPLEQGHGNLLQRIRAEAAAEASASMGDSGVTHSSGDGCHGRHPTGDSGVTPMGDSGVTQIGNRITKGYKPTASARERDAALRAWSAKAPERVSPELVERAWADAEARSGLSGEQLLAAVQAAVARDPDFGRGKAMNLHRWLDEGRFVAWLAEGSIASPSPISAWAGPAEVEAVVVSTLGAAGVVSYLRSAGWDRERRTVMAATSIAAQRLRDGAGQALKAIGVTVEIAAAGSARHG